MYVFRYMCCFGIYISACTWFIILVDWQVCMHANDSLYELIGRYACMHKHHCMFVYVHAYDSVYESIVCLHARMIMYHQYMSWLFVYKIICMHGWMAGWDVSKCVLHLNKHACIYAFSCMQRICMNVNMSVCMHVNYTYVYRYIDKHPVQQTNKFDTTIPNHVYELSFMILMPLVEGVDTSILMYLIP
jgi:hypothetical protein